MSQIPALIVSTAAGLLVTKAGVSGSAEKAVLGQLGERTTRVLSESREHRIVRAGGLVVGGHVGRRFQP